MKAKRRLIFRSFTGNRIEWMDRHPSHPPCGGYCPKNNGVFEESLAFIETIGPDKAVSVCENGDEVAVWYWSEK